MSGRAKSYEEAVAAAMAEAKARGLPDGWTVKFDNRNRRKWVCPGPNSRMFDSLPKALARARKMGAIIPDDLPTSAATTSSSSTKKRPAASSSSGPASKRLRGVGGGGGAADGTSSARLTKYPPTPAFDEYDDGVEPEPEPDPETAFDVVVPAAGGGSGGAFAAGGSDDVNRPSSSSSGRAATVHWNPESPAGRKVGYRIRIFDVERDRWRAGRVARYDPGSNKHKVRFDDEKQKQKEGGRWIRLHEEATQIGCRFVWALVKGFAWWPALALECDPPPANFKPGYVYVEFFGTNEFATVKDAPDFIRPFDMGKVDSVMQKNKKKLNQKAIELACADQVATREARNAAVLFYAEKAFAFASRKANGLLGHKVRFFRSDVNYPYGDTVTCTVRQYSPTTKKFLLSFDPSPKTRVKYEPAWINLLAKECAYKLVDAEKGKDFMPSELDLAPYMFGYSSDGLVGSLPPALSGRCAGCLEEDSGSDPLISCGTCCCSFHSYCLDPPMNPRTAEKIVDDGDLWLCHKCTLCRGCSNLDISFGSRPQPPPSTLVVEDRPPLDLCSTCVPLYEKDRYCPDCGHCWDDVKYQKTRCVIRWQNKKLAELKARLKKKKQSEEPSRTEQPTGSAAKSAPQMLIAPETESNSFFLSASEIDPSWFYPDTSVWGFNEGSMLVCDSCNLWVHAGCAGLSREEYDATNAREHPIYSKEFLCRICCQRRCQLLIDELKKEDAMFLFASPVTEKMAPTYHDVIKNPMDLTTMTKRSRDGSYHNYAWVRESFELMVLNALTFNRPYSKFWNEAKRYHEACLGKVFRAHGKAAPPGKWAEAVQISYDKAEKLKEMERERVKQDETAEKKDLVAGAEITKVHLQPLSTPVDQQSCVPSAGFMLNKVDAYYCAWMECCFTCGSSGAADTMLFCVDCGEAYHTFCANAPIHSMSAQAVDGWRCPNCKVCEISGDVPEDETKMLYCEMCDRAFTLDLLEPPLKSVPTGLWICGQCVDCKSCDNLGEKGRVSLKYWSRDPDKCFRCGGCKGLVEKYVKGMKCPICSKIWRSTDTDVVQCKACKLGFHAGCDMMASDFLRRKRVDGSASSRSISGESGRELQYECPKCRDNEEEKKLAKSLQKHFREQARQILMRRLSLAPNGTDSLQDFHSKLSDEVDWHLKEMWRNEYESVVKEGRRIYDLFEAKFGGKKNPCLASALNGSQFPPWMVTRAARWIRHLKSQDGKDVSHPRGIKSLVRKATMASSFIKIASQSLSMSQRSIKGWNRMSALLLQTKEETGTIQFEPDSLRPDPIRKDIIPESDWRSDELDEKIIQALSSIDPSNKRISEAFRSNEMSSASQEAGSGSVLMTGYHRIHNGQSAGDMSNSDLLLRLEERPLRGWDRNEKNENSKQWRDPRVCCLCHTCGDDDAGLSPYNEEEEASIGGGDLAGEAFLATHEKVTARAGRLLPMTGGIWVHSACALWSSEVWESQQDGYIYAVDKARYRGSKLKCFGCGRPGATLGCQKTNCPRNYHFPCAKACGSVFTTKHEMFCHNHRNVANAEVSSGAECCEVMKILKVKEERDCIRDSSLCFRMGSLVVHSLGSIEQDHDGFHSETHVTPPGYVASRIFWSFSAVKKRTLYILNVDRTPGKVKPLFSVIAADAPHAPIQGGSMSKVYSILMDRVREANRSNFSQGDFFSRFPMQRKKGLKTYGLNGPQFFGLGLNQVREMLENGPGVAALAVALEADSPTYKFCFHHPQESDMMHLQRERAAAAAEKALENASGCARTEGMSAVDRSGGSGRITRALVRRADEAQPAGAPGSGSGRGRTTQGESKSDVDSSNQTKYEAMKSVPMDQRLAAKRSHIHGWGLFTKLDLPKHSMIVEYMGETVRQCVADKRERQYETSGIGSCYMFRLDRQRIVDATRIGCMARFMNHCCRPNAYANVVTVYTDQGPEKKIVVFANREISAGEEITYDYKFPVEDGSLRCTCGAPNCIGRMN